MPALARTENGRHVDRYVFKGTPSELGRAQGAIGSGDVREQLNELLEKPHDFGHPYFRKNAAFMRREFPELIEEMEAFGAAAGIEDFDQTYYLHTKYTGRGAEGCSSLGISLVEDGPALLTTNDACHGGNVEVRVKETVLKTFPEVRPHGVMGIGSRAKTGVWRTVNDRGLCIGSASGHPKFNWPDDPEYVNFQFHMRLIPQYCGDCDDVRHFINQYRVSGVKGITCVAIDAKGNILGLELESENVAFREPEDGLLLEVNHWQHPDLATPAWKTVPRFWERDYYYNSFNRIQYLAYHRERFGEIRTMPELVDFCFDHHAPGRILQVPGYNIANWATTHAVFMTARDRRMRVYALPLNRESYDEATCPG